MDVTKENLFTFINTKLSIKYHYLIFILLKKHNIPYSSNNNGIFVNFKQIDDKVLGEICMYLNTYMKSSELTKDKKDEDTTLSDVVLRNLNKDIVSEVDISLTPDELVKWNTLNAEFFSSFDKKPLGLKTKIIRKKILNKGEVDNFQISNLLTKQEYY